MGVLPITVEKRLYDEMASSLGEPFADSYLSGAIQNGRSLTPRTLHAYDKLRFTPAARHVLEREGVALTRPERAEPRAAERGR